MGACGGLAPIVAAARAAAADGVAPVVLRVLK